MNHTINSKVTSVDNKTLPCLYFLIVISTWGSSLLSITIAVSRRIPILSYFASYIPTIIIIIAILLSIKHILRKLRGTDIFLYFFVVIVYCLQYLFYSINTELLDEYFTKVLLSTVPLYFVGCLIEIEILDKYFSIASILSIMYLLLKEVYSLESPSGYLEEGEYSMHFAYVTLPFALYAMWDTLRYKDIKSASALVISIFLLFSYGTRGPIVCLLAFPILYIIFRPSNSKEKLLWLFILILVILLIAVFFINIMDYIVSFFNHLGLSNRIIEYYINERLDEDSGRSYIIEVLRSNMVDNAQFTGYGLFGSWRYVDGYAHRLYWDLWFSFGYFFGTILIIAIVLLLYKGLRHCKTDKEIGLWLVLFCSGLLPLFLSDYFLFRSWFFVLLGYCVSIIRSHHRNYKCP